MFNNFVAKVRRLAGLPCEDVSKLLKWMSKSVEFDNPHLLVASATDENGSPILYTMVEPAFLVDAYAMSPQATEPSAYKAGLAMDEALVRTAQERGVSTILVVLPHYAPRQRDERTLRVLERTVPVAAGSNIDPSSQATQFLN